MRAQTSPPLDPNIQQSAFAMPNLKQECQYDMWSDAEGVVKLISQLWSSESGSVDDRQLDAAVQLADLADGCQQIQDTIVAAGVVLMLAAWLKSGQHGP